MILFPISIIQCAIVLLSTMILRSCSMEIPHCLIYDEMHQSFCNLCEKGFLLNQIQTSCEQHQRKSEGEANNLSNCIQISFNNECIRCGCGYALQETSHGCVIADQVNNLLGCETFKDDNNCTRPKAEYLLLKGGKPGDQALPIQYARGTHCEIFDLMIGECSQCHSGYRLTPEKKCQRHTTNAPIFNEFFSYFSPEGILQSRYLQFVATSFGVYPKIANCIAYMPQTAQDSKTMRCQECSAGRALTKSKMECVRQPFDLCRVVSDFDHSYCEECVDSDYFYMGSSYLQEQICLPRQQIDPTTRCLLYSINSQLCKQCQLGLVQTPQGCSLEEEEDNKGITRESQEVDEITNNHLYLEALKFSDVNCIFWINNGICGQCAWNMDINNKGYCQINPIRHCLVPRDQGGCFRCISQMFYLESQNVCKYITGQNYCTHSSGLSNSCNQCITGYYLTAQGLCDQLPIINCLRLSESQNDCELCMNLYFLYSPMKCSAITEVYHCLVSDGLADRCVICKRNYSLDKPTGLCIPQISISEIGFCIDQRYYFDAKTQSCREHELVNKQACFHFVVNENTCLECMSGYYLQSGYCFAVQNCKHSDGIHDWCYQAGSNDSFINGQGRAEKLIKNCMTNGIEEKCISCNIGNGYQGKFLETIREKKRYQDENSSSFEECIDFYQLNIHDLSQFQSLEQCQHLQFKEQQNLYFCDLCENLFYPNENGACTPILDINCLVSSGRSNECILCLKNYSMNIESRLCEVKSEKKLLFCEISRHEICVKCKNLYYITVQQLCMPIHDPDCEESDGIANNCVKCTNGRVIKTWILNNLIEVSCAYLKQFLKINEDFLSFIDSLNNETSITNITAMREESFKQNGDSLTVFDIWWLAQLNCKKFSMMSLRCIECSEGYYLSFDVTHMRCIKINIDNCIALKENNQDCTQCREGYKLTKLNNCVRMENCLNFSEACLKCSEESFLFEGSCVKLRNCEQQHEEVCFKCSPGYFLVGQDQDEGGEVGRMKSSRGQLSIGQKNTAVNLNQCMKLIHCSESDGISSYCQKCERGFELRNQICVKNSYLAEFRNCEVFSDDFDCLKCKNLFYLSDGKCIMITQYEGLNNCQKSNGITDHCIQCSFRGFMLTEKGNCQMIDRCQISNGLDWCVVCEEYHIVSAIGTCIQIETQIFNCELYYSYDRARQAEIHQITRQDDYTEDSFGNSSFNRERRIQERHVEETDQSDIPFSPAISSPETQGCIRCPNLFYPHGRVFQSCIKMHFEKQIECAFSKGTSDHCSVCYSGYLLRTTQVSKSYLCHQGKRSLKLVNYGCEVFNYFYTCIRCYENYFLRSDAFCKHKRLSQKCKIFDLKKDECLECNTGYTLKTIREHDLMKTICMRLEVSGRVENCQEYYPNTNRCARCIKRLGQHILEYVLNEKENICEDVLHRFCRKFDMLDTSICLEEYIEGCKIYGQAQDRNRKGECIACQNGYFIRDKTCIKHMSIKNCKKYSHVLSDTCEICDQLFFLKEPHLCASVSHSNHCRIYETHRDRCERCNSRFTVDVVSGECIESQILHCKSAQGGSYQICAECKDNFYLSESKTECLFRLFDESNCKIGNSQNECIECNPGYLLTSSGDCVFFKSSSCSVDFCEKYAEKSTTESMICEKCERNYKVNEKFRCSLLLDAELHGNNIHVEEEQAKIDSMVDNTTIYQIMKTWFVRIFFSIIVFFGVMKLFLVIVRKFRQNRRPLLQQINLASGDQRNNDNFIQNQGESTVQVGAEDKANGSNSALEIEI